MPKSSSNDGPLYTLTEVAQKTGISMPTLQRYKKLYQARIPSVGKGRKQRYPEESLPVFEEIKKENISRRGRPRKDSSEKAPAQRKKRKSTRGRKASTKKTAESTDKSDLLTLTEIGKRTGISYPTLSRYVRKFGDQLSSEGKGRSRRFHPEAVEQFQELRSQSRRGGGRKASAGKKTTRKASGKRGRRSAATSSGDEALAGRVAQLEKQLKALERKLSKPIRVTVLPKN